MHQLSDIEQSYNKMLILFDRISILFSLIPLMYIWKVYYTKDKAIKVFTYFILASILLHIIEHIHIWIVLTYDPYWEIMKKLNIRDTNFFNIFYRLNIYIFLGIFYEEIIVRRTIHQISIIHICCILIIFSILIYFFVDGYNQFGTVNSIVSRSFQILFSLISINQIFKSKLNTSIWKNPYFLINLGILLPNSFTLLLSFLSDTFHKTNFILYVQSVIIRNVITLLGEIFFTMAFYYSSAKKLN